MEPLFIPRDLPAGAFLQRGGDVATHAAFVATTGCLRSYVIDGKDKEHIGRSSSAFPATRPLFAAAYSAMPLRRISASSVP
jgi:hypothetical protein